MQMQAKVKIMKEISDNWELFMTMYTEAYGKIKLKIKYVDKEKGKQSCLSKFSI